MDVLNFLSLISFLHRNSGDSLLISAYASLESK